MQKSFYALNIYIFFRVLTIVKLVVVSFCVLKVVYAESKTEFLSVIPGVRAEVIKGYLRPEHVAVLINSPIKKISFLGDELAENVKETVNKNKNQIQSRSELDPNFELPELNLDIDETIIPESGDPHDFFSTVTQPPDSQQIGGIPFQFSVEPLGSAEKNDELVPLQTAILSEEMHWYHEPISGAIITDRPASLIGFPIIGNAGPSDSEKGSSCFLERSGDDWLCIEDVTWPLRISDAFQIKGVVYEGTKAIVRYRNGQVNRINAAFHAKQFSMVADYLRNELGRPSLVKKRTLVKIASPNETNLSILWQFKRLEGRTQTIEIRAINDARGLFPDSKYGVLLAYDDMAESIFESVEVSDFMLHKLRRTNPKYKGF